MASKKTYHHGDLRRALLEAAVDRIGEAGPRGFTMREVARRAGVSHNAPYRHFRSRADLVDAVATQGFGELTRAMVTAAKACVEPTGRLRACGLAYVGFALRRPEHFAVMFDTPPSLVEKSERSQAGRAAFEVLVKAVEGCLPGGAGDPLGTALVAWSLVHGIANLAIAERLPHRGRAQVLRFADTAIGDMLRRGLPDVRSVGLPAVAPVWPPC